MRAVWLLIAVLAVAGCARIGRGARLGALPYFPGAAVVGSTSFVGELSGFPRASWDQVELRSQARFEQVRDFYAKVEIKGWSSKFETEVPKRTGRVFTRFLADNRRREFYTITIEERVPSKDVSVLLRRGLAR